MGRRFTPLAAAVLISLAATNAEAVRLSADVDRNGVIDGADEFAKTAWSWERGAIFLNNCDSDSGTTNPDHADAIVNGAEDLKDLALLRLAQIPDLAPGASVTISVDAAASSRVRIFLRNGGGEYTSIHPGGGTIPADLLRAGDVELRIEANSFALPQWNGEVLVTATVSGAGELNGSDAVRLRVAPWLMLSNIQRATEVYFRDYRTMNLTMKQDMQAIFNTIGVTLRVQPGGSTPYSENDIWMQDAFEVGYSEMPGQSLSVVLQANRGGSWNLGNYARDVMLAPDYGWFRVGAVRNTFGGGSAPDGWLDWFGNLEVTPPIPGFPYGQVFYGRNPDTGGQLDPAITGMINAQGLQGPALALDAGWLLIQHVDEIVCWVPGPVEGEWKILVPDTTVMYDLLDQWVADGLSATPMMRLYEAGETVGAFRNDSGFRTTNLNLQSTRIEPVIQQMMTAWSLSEEDVIRIPAAFFSNGGAYIPSMVNALVTNGHIFMADPHGPEPQGTDLLQQYVIDRLAEEGVPLQPHFVDDSRYHRWSGNVHCATNARRDGFSPPIWESLTRQPAMGWEGWMVE